MKKLKARHRVFIYYMKDYEDGEKFELEKINRIELSGVGI
jgi:hypothetical protein